jgi:hypothetical protein
MIIAQERNWEDARNHCHARGAFLADILDAKKQQYLSGLHFYLSLNELVKPYSGKDK